MQTITSHPKEMADRPKEKRKDNQGEMSSENAKSVLSHLQSYSGGGGGGGGVALGGGGRESVCWSLKRP